MQPRLRFLAALLAAAGAAVVIGGLAGVVLGAVVFALVRRWLATLEPRAERDRRRRLAADLPVAAELLAAALAAGSTLEGAAASAADAVGGPLGDALRSAAGALLLGAGTVEAWQALAADAELAPLGPLTRERRWRPRWGLLRTISVGAGAPLPMRRPGGWECAPWCRSASAFFPHSSSSESCR
jgi:hypothetical protein